MARKGPMEIEYLISSFWKFAMHFLANWSNQGAYKGAPVSHLFFVHENIKKTDDAPAWLP